MSAPILEAIDLVKHCPAGKSPLLHRPTAEVKAVAGVSLTLERGRTLGVVGESGCGKSTLGRLLGRLLEPTSGRVLLDGHDLTAAKPSELRALRRTIQYVFQDPYSCLNPRHTVAESIATPMRIQGLYDRATEREKVRELMERVGLNPEHVNRFPHEFSGGQRQRIGVARALALEPRIVVADEPVSALDVSVQAQILNLLEGLQASLGLSYVFITHDLAVVRHIADRVAVMYLGKVVETGTPAEVYDGAAHPYTRALLSAVPLANPRRRGEHRRVVLSGDVPSPINPPSGCRFRTRCPKAQDQCAVEEPALMDRGFGHPVACHFPGD